LKYSFPTKTPFKSNITCKGLTFVSFASMRRRDLKPSKMSSFPLPSLAVSWRNLGSLSFLTPSNPTRGNYGRSGTDSLSDGKDVNANWGGDIELRRDKVETTSISFISPTFSHVISNAIQSHPNVQIIERLSFEFH